MKQLIFCFQVYHFFIVAFLLKTFVHYTHDFALADVEAGAIPSRQGNIDDHRQIDDAFYSHELETETVLQQSE